MPEGKSYRTAKGHSGSAFRQNRLLSSVDRKEACAEEGLLTKSVMSASMLPWILQEDSGDNDHRS